MKSVRLGACIAALGLASTAVAGPSASSIDKVFADWNKQDGPGCALTVVENGKVAYEHGYGMANLEHGVRITPDSVFYIASVSKQFTAAAVALLAEEGALSLDDDVRRFVPEVPVYDKPILVRHLIHHTSGLRDYLHLWTASGRSHVDSIPENEAIALVARQDALDFTPGSEYRYSNSGYMLLSVIVKRASGRSLRQYAQEKIFGPLGMTHTAFHDDRTTIVPKRVSAYLRREPQDGGGWGVYQTSFDLVGDGGVVTSVRDLYLWDQNFYDNKLGKRGQAFMDSLLVAEPLTDGKPGAYAFGLRFDEYAGRRTVGHGGSFIGYKADLVRIPERRLSVITLCNSPQTEPTKMNREILDLYLGKKS